jgi:hypothetical protein
LVTAAGAGATMIIASVPGGAADTATVSVIPAEELSDAALSQPRDDVHISRQILPGALIGSQRRERKAPESPRKP